MIYLNIDGTDITNLIAYGGYKVSREDADGPGAGRDLTGDLMRNRLATKYRVDATCIPLQDRELTRILRLIAPEWVTVQYYNPFVGSIQEHTMYSNNINVQVAQIYRNGRVLWGGFTFPLVQK